MSISVRVALAVSFASVLLLAVSGSWLLVWEERLLLEAAEREALLLATGMAVAAENAVRDGQLADAQEVLDRIDRLRPGVDVVVWGLVDGHSVSASSAPPAGLHYPDLTAAVEGGETLLLPEPAADPLFLLVGIPLRADDGAIIGGLVLSSPLGEMKANLAGARRATVLAMLLSTAITIALGLALGRVLIGRPAARLFRRMRQLRGGGVPDGSPPPRGDELAAVAEEFSLMVEDLELARRRLLEETDARLRLEHGLRRVDKMVTVGQLSAGLAHEIGSPLQILSGRARSLLDGIHPPGEVRRVAGIIVEQSERVVRIVEHLLRFARRRPPQFQSADLCAVVRTVVDFIDLSARRQGVRVTLAPAPSLILPLDPDAMQQVVLNLLTNAVKAASSGGAVAVEIEAVTARGLARIVVTDTGPGLSPQAHARLFEPFFTTAGEGGTGLGLAVVRAIVTDHGGVVSATSEPGIGSRFVVELPIHGRRLPVQAVA